MKSRTKIAIISAVVLIVLIAVNYLIDTKELTFNSKADYEQFKLQLDNTIPQLMDKYGVPGTAMAVIRNGKLEAVKGYGWADRENGIKVKGDTVFQVASNSKTVTGWGIMKLVESGKLKLDEPVGKYLTRWKLPQSKYDSNGVTIRRILSHTSGLKAISYAGYSPRQPLPSLEQSLSGDAAGVAPLELATQPGTKYKYSGGGFTLAQLIIEEITGKSFSSYMEEEVLKPLGMENSCFELKPGFHKEIAKAYGVRGESFPNYLYTEKAAAGLYTTAEDFAHFVEANIRVFNEKDSSENVIGNKSLSLMYTPGKKDYGLGYIIKKLPDGTRLIYHGGTNRGWRAQFAILPEKSEGLVVLTNSENGERLHRDLVSLWVKWQTGYWPGFHMGDVALRVAVKTVAILLGLLLVAAIWAAVRDVSNKKRFLVVRSEKFSAKMVFKVIVKCLLLLGVTVVWWVAFYTGTVYKGWTLASFAPLGFSWITHSVFAWCIFFCMRSWFVKERLHNAENSGKIVNTKIKIGG